MTFLKYFLVLGTFFSAPMHAMESITEPDAAVAASAGVSTVVRLTLPPSSSCPELTSTGSAGNFVLPLSTIRIQQSNNSFNFAHIPASRIFPDSEAIVQAHPYHEGLPWQLEIFIPDVSRMSFCELIRFLWRNPAAIPFLRENQHVVAQLIAQHSNKITMTFGVLVLLALAIQKVYA